VVERHFGLRAGWSTEVYEPPIETSETELDSLTGVYTYSSTEVNELFSISVGPLASDIVKT